MSVEVAEQRQEREESFNNAVVLNNLACVLLRSGAFFDAFTTFRGAVDMLQSASVRRGETGLGKVAVALRKLRDTESLCGGSADVTVIGFEDEAIQHVVYEAAFGELMPYTITLRSPNQEEYGRDPDIDCAIILHNYALSHILLSQRGLLPDKQAHKGALYVFRVAFRIMFEKFGGLLDADGTVVNFGSVANYDMYVDSDVWSCCPDAHSVF